MILISKSAAIWIPSVSAAIIVVFFLLRKRLAKYLIPVEIKVERFVTKSWVYLKRVGSFEFSTSMFTVAILLLAAITCTALRAHYTRDELHGLQEITETISSILNFMGVMLVAQGVILLKKDKIRIRACIRQKGRFPLLVARLFTDASACCEKGSLFVVLAFVLDMVAKFVF
jgi:hypothetical protein